MWMAVDLVEDARRWPWDGNERRTDGLERGGRGLSRLSARGNLGLGRAGVFPPPPLAFALLRLQRLVPWNKAKSHCAGPPRSLAARWQSAPQVLCVLAERERGRFCGWLLQAAKGGNWTSQSR